MAPYEKRWHLHDRRVRNWLASSITCMICIMTFGYSEAQPKIPANERVYVTDKIPLHCSDYTAERIGVRYVATLIDNTSKHENHKLKIRLFRFEPKESTTTVLGGREYKLAYRDIAIASHSNWGLENYHLVKLISQIGIANSRNLVDSETCLDRTPSAIHLYSPLVQSDGTKVNVTPRIVYFVADIFIQSDKRINPESIVKDFPESGIDIDSDFDEKYENQVDAKKILRIYSWVDNFRLKEMADAEPVLVVEKSECSEQGNFFVVSTGHLLGDGVSNPGEDLTVIRSEIYAINHYYGASGNPTKRHVVESSVDPTHYWCVPKREFCYKRVKFGKFDVNVRKGRTDKVHIERVYNLRLGIVSALQLIVTDFCPDTENYILKENTE